MSPTLSFECCGAIYTHLGDDSRVRPPRVCRDCPRRYFLTVRRFTKPEGFEPGQVLRINDLIEIVTGGAGQ